jgi:hypothetical protein
MALWVALVQGCQVGAVASTRCGLGVGQTQVAREVGLLRRKVLLHQHPPLKDEAQREGGAGVGGVLGPPGHCHQGPAGLSHHLAVVEGAGVHSPSAPAPCLTGPCQTLPPPLQCPVRLHLPDLLLLAGGGSWGAEEGDQRAGCRCGVVVVQWK